MKKNLLFSAMALGMGLLSCTQDDLGNKDALAPVTISVEVPANAYSRALPVAPAEHKLRCIMLVDYATEGTQDGRIEKIATGQEVNGVFRFSFTPAEQDYTCYFWADYVGEDGADKYYNTTDLANITYKVNDNTVFNNPACDAFYGKALNGSTTATLKRPFTKLTIVDKNQETVQNAASLGVSYAVPSGFNIKDNTTASTETLAMTGGNPYDAANSVWFYNYVFTATDDNSLGDIIMTVGEEQHTLKGADIPLNTNYEITGTIDFASANGNINIDVDIDDDFVDPNAPKLGQFLQKDGTFADTYDAENSIAIVFAVGPKGDDVATNYGKAEGTKIWGYAMGLSSVARTKIQDENNQAFPDLKDLNGDAPWAADDYSGYLYTNKFIEKVGDYKSLLMAKFETWKGENSLNGLDNVSGWYIPSSRQLLDLIGLSYGCKDKEDTTAETPVDDIDKNETLAAAVESVMVKEDAKSYFGNHTGAANIMSSYVRAGRMMCVQTNGGDNETISSVLGVTISSSSDSPFVIRPVLTIFAKQQQN